MLVQAKAGQDPEDMTYIKFQGILDRVHKLRRWDTGGGITKDEAMADRMEALKAEQDDF